LKKTLSHTECVYIALVLKCLNLPLTALLNNATAAGPLALIPA
jgi:hypothetical protein